MHGRRLLLYGTAAFVAAMAVGEAMAADQPISARKLTLRQTAAKQRLVFTANDPAALFPAIGGPDDPATGSPGGALVELFAPGQPTAVLSVPSGVGKPGWTVRDGNVDRYQYRNALAPDGPSPVKRLVLKQGRAIRLTAAATGLSLAGPLGSVGIRITTGSLRSCALFDAATVTRDDPGRFSARHAAASSLADCSDASLGAAPSTTTTTSSSTSTTVPLCGDGIVNGDETCDGAPDPSAGCFPEPAGSCVPPGSPDECQCCTNSDCDGFADTCCDGTCQVLFIGGLGSCYDPTCGPGDDCAVGQACVDGSCCLPQPGARCAFVPSGALIPCCAPLVCAPVANQFEGSCCLPPGEACTLAASCCTGSCTAGVCDP